MCCFFYHIKISLPLHSCFVFVVGQLSVEGGSRPFSEATGRPSILRPQPVACMAMPSLCHSVRDQGCAYQAFCQPQLCCLHCRPAQPVLVEKYPAPVDKCSVQCSQQPGCNSPPSLQRCQEGTALLPPSTVHSSQQPTPPPVPDSIQLSPERALLHHPATSECQPQNEQQSTVTDSAVVSNRASTLVQPPSGREQASSDLETLLEKQQQQAHPPAQPSAEPSPVPAAEQQPLGDCRDEDGVGSWMCRLPICMSASS